MRGDFFSGWLKLAGDFPPSVNTADDPSKLKPYESPSCYGAEVDTSGYLESGTIPTGTAKTSRSVSIGSDTYTWLYNRMWRASGNDIIWGPPEYDDFYIPHNVGRLRADASIITFVPFGGNSLAIVTATGTNVIRNATDPSGRFQFDFFLQGLYADTSTKIVTVDDVLFVANAGGVFSYDGRGIKEITAPVRTSLGSFADVEIKANYIRKWIIGTAKFVIDLQRDRLLDFGTTGFRFTSRTMEQQPYTAPFIVDRIALLYDKDDTDNSYIDWTTKANDEDWYTEETMAIVDGEGERTRAEFQIDNPRRNVSKFAVRLTSISSNIKIKEIQLSVKNLALGSITE